MVVLIRNIENNLKAVSSHATAQDLSLGLLSMMSLQIQFSWVWLMQFYKLSRQDNKKGLARRVNARAWESEAKVAQNFWRGGVPIKLGIPILETSCYRPGWPTSDPPNSTS